MRKFHFFITVLFLFSAKSVFSGDFQWEKDYFKAFVQAKEDHKDVFLFLGHLSGCDDCDKFLQVLRDKNFSDYDGVVFLSIDLYSDNFFMPEKLRENKKIKELLGERRHFFVAVLDEDENVITKMDSIDDVNLGRIRLALKKYGDFKKVDLAGIDLTELKKMYNVSKDLKLDDFKNRIISKGMEKEELFFYLEKYVDLMDRGDFSEALSVKKEIIAKDPKNLKKSHLKLAVTDFKSFENKREPKMVVKPILDYIEKFGKEDKDEVWSLFLMVSRYFNESGNVKDALFYARESYKKAPLHMRPELARTVLSLKKKLREDGQ